MLFSQRGSKRHSKDSLLVILSEIANADKDRFDRFRLFVRGSRARVPASCVFKKTMNYIKCDGIGYVLAPTHY